MIVVVKANAVAELLELVGPHNSDQWPHAPTSLRARFGKTEDQIGVRCSLQEETVATELEFLLNHTSPRQQTIRHRPLSAAKSANVDLEGLITFLFPPHMHHPNSTGRLFVFGLYGPLDHEARLRSGEKGFHIVTDQELQTMASRMEREDILAVYNMCSLSQEEEEQVLRHVDRSLQRIARHSKRDIYQLFRALPRGPDGFLSFHDMQAYVASLPQGWIVLSNVCLLSSAIMKERCRRVLCMKEHVHPGLAPPIQNKFRHTLTRIRKTKDEIAPASMFIKDMGFTGAENATLVARLLSNHSFQICHLDDGNSPALTQNVRLLREEIHVPQNETRPTWNPSCHHQT
jgi:hypothetical protein